MSRNRKGLFSLFSNDPAKPMKWGFMASPDCLARIDSVPIIHELQSDYRQSQAAQERVQNEADPTNAHLMKNKLAKSKMLNDIVRCGHLNTEDAYYLISSDVPDEATVKKLRETHAPKPLEIVILKNDIQQNQFYALLKANFDEKYGSKAADYIMANMHQDGFLNIGRSYLLAQAKMNGHEMLKTSDTSIEIGRAPNGEITITERFLVQDLVDYVNSDMQSIEPSDKPLAHVVMSSRLVQNDEGQLEVQAKDFKIGGETTAATREAFKTLVSPHPSLLPEQPKVGTEIENKENIPPNRQRNR